MSTKNIQCTSDLSSNIADVYKNIPLQVYRFNSILESINELSKEIDHSHHKMDWEVEFLFDITAEINALAEAIHTATSNVHDIVKGHLALESKKPI